MKAADLDTMEFACFIAWTTVFVHEKQPPGHIAQLRSQVQQLALLIRLPHVILLMTSGCDLYCNTDATGVVIFPRKCQIDRTLGIVPAYDFY